MKRRQFVAAFAAVSVARAAWGQQGTKQWRIGILANEPWSALEALVSGLKELGYAEGQNLKLDYRWFEGHAERLPALAADLVRLKADVIVTVDAPIALAAKQATAGVPVVVGLAGDAAGAELELKRLELLKELIPGLSRVAVLWNPRNPNGASAMRSAQGGADRLGLRLEQVGIAGPDELSRGFTELLHMRPQAVLVVADQMLLTQRIRIADFLTKNRLPSAYTYREHVEAGGLLSYSTNYDVAFRRAADSVDRILKGEKAADLPVEQAARFDLVLNRKAAKTMGITIPQALLLRADRVIE